MGFIKKTVITSEYQGESFTRTIVKEDGATWAEEHGGFFNMYDEAGLEKFSGNLVKSDDELGLTFTYGTTNTADLDGKYLLLVTLTDTGDPEFNDVIAEYLITYRIKQA